MIRWGLLLVAVIVNLFWIATSQGACFVTWAQIVPREINCSLCSQPEIQAVLIRAAELGRQQICNSLPSLWLIICFAIINVAIIAALLFSPAFSKLLSGSARSH
jgi:hypothetical protein